MSHIQTRVAKIASFFLATLITIFGLSQISDSQNVEPLVWAASAMEDIQIQQVAQTGETANRIQLTAAKGEDEAFQIVVQAPGVKLGNVNVYVSDLKTASGSLIERNNITLYREHYLKLERPSTPGWLANPTRGKGWYADALIPFVDPDTGEDLQGAELDAVPFNLDSGLNQPIWVDISVPRSVDSGEYRGTYTVTSDSGNVTGQINLKVWNFSLPVKPSMNSYFNIWEDRGLQAQSLMLEHKLMPSQRIDYPNQAEAFEQLGVTSVKLPFWSGANYQTCKMSPAPAVDDLRKSANKYGSDVLKYVYSADEIDKCQDLMPTLKNWANNIHSAAANIKHLVVMEPRPELYEDIDIWVVDPRKYRLAGPKISRVMQQGDQVWFYTGYHAKYSPVWHLDSPPINFRIPQGWISQSLNLTGVLLSRVDLWVEDPWTEVPIYVQGKEDYPGVETYFYPGDKVGISQVVPSIKLKRVREGIEDYEYIEILKQLGYEEQAIEIVHSVAKNWLLWTKNPDDLYQARLKIATKIDQLKSSAS